MVDMRSLHILVSSVALCALATACGGGSTASAPLPATTPPPTTPGALVLTPTTLNFLASGASSAQTFSADETGYTGAFTETDTCNALATVSTPSSSGPAATYTVVPLGAGTCTITIRDSNGQKHTIAVSLTLTQGGVN
jgi:hypothetical protein